MESDSSPVWQTPIPIQGNSDVNATNSVISQKYSDVASTQRISKDISLDEMQDRIPHELDGRASILETLNRCCSTDSELWRLNYENSAEEHIFIAAVLHGWEAYETHVAINPSWSSVRRLDQEIFRGKDVAMRLSAILFWPLLRYLRWSKESRLSYQTGVPSWLLPRPSQDALDHTLAVDLVPWPGMRERLCFGKDKYLTDDFWSKFIAHWKFTWPYNITSTYVVDIRTGLLRLSPEFQRRLHDFASWTMDDAFFDWYPEFEPDILHCKASSTDTETSQQSARKVPVLHERLAARKLSVRKRLSKTGWRSDQPLGKYLRSLALLEESNVHSRTRSPLDSTPILSVKPKEIERFEQAASDHQRKGRK